MSNAAKDYWSKKNTWFLNAYEESLFEKIIHGPLKLRAEVAVLATKLTSSKRILDLGCGPSKVIYRCLSETSAESAIGLDFSASMLTESSRFLKSVNMLDRVELINCDLLEIGEYPKADIAIALGLFDYMSDPETILEKAHKSCDYLVASWPRPSIRNYLRKFRYSCGVYTYTEKDVINLLNKIGISSIQFIEGGPLSGFVSISSKK